MKDNCFFSALRAVRLYDLVRHIYGKMRAVGLRVSTAHAIWVTNRLFQRKQRKLKRSHRPIVVYFMAINKTQWLYQETYELMEKDPSFDPYVLVCPEWVTVGKDADHALIEHFTAKGMRVVTKVDNSRLPDVLFFPNLVVKSWANVVDLKTIYDKVLCCSNIYGFATDSNGYTYIFNPMFRYMWRQYVHCEYYRKLATERGLRRGDNVVVSGCLKTDWLYHTTGNCPIWKDQERKRKRIIYAPHWSVLTFGRMSNFDRYYDKFYNFLLQHPEVEIAFKPHPMLKPRLTNQTIKDRLRATDHNWGFVDVDCLSTEKEYDDFLAKWCALPNASYMEAGDYSELFMSSDAMILDSVSFMAEYMITKKPMCFCVRETLDELIRRNDINELGQDLFTAMTIAEDWDGIVRFIEKIVSTGDDGLQSKREEVYAKHLDVNPGHVNQFIVDDVKSSLLG